MSSDFYRILIGRRNHGINHSTMTYQAISRVGSNTTFEHNMTDDV